MPSGKRVGTMRGLDRAPDALFSDLALEADAVRALGEGAAGLPERLPMTGSAG